MTIKTCSYCEKEFSRKQSAIDKYKNNYCSWECAKHNQETKIEINCGRCGDKFYLTPTQYHRGKRFCSKKCLLDKRTKDKEKICVICGTKFMNKYPSSTTITCSKKCVSILRKTGEYKHCKQCEKLFWVFPSVKEIKFFCSMDCHSKWKSENLVGENNHNWKNGLSNFPYPIGWSRKLKSKIRERDGQICKECGSVERLTVHHIDYDKDNLSEDNLITLCTVCNSKANTNRSHWQEHYSQKMEVNYGRT